MQACRKDTVHEVVDAQPLAVAGRQAAGQRVAEAGEEVVGVVEPPVIPRAGIRWRRRRLPPYRVLEHGVDQGRRDDLVERGVLPSLR